MELEIGQVLWLKIKYQANIISNVPHPMLIESIVCNIDENIIEVIAIDKDRDRAYQLLSQNNKFVSCNSPLETVISENSYVQLNNKFTIEYFKGLENYRRTKDKLSNRKLNEILKAYRDFHKNNIIKEERIVHMTKKDILDMND